MKSPPTTPSPYGPGRTALQGWSPTSGIRRLRDLAVRCEDVRPDLARAYRQEADQWEREQREQTAKRGV